MHDNNSLREKACEAMRAGRMPNRRPARTWGGPGGGARCAICGAPVKQDEVEFEIEFANDAASRDERHVHVACFAAWEIELQELERAAAAIASNKQQSPHTAAIATAAPALPDSVHRRALPARSDGVNIAGSGCDPTQR